MEIYKLAVVRALKALFNMIFKHGFVHCDLHPGNLKYNPAGTVVFLDCGFTASLSDIDREDFLHFFLSLVLNKGQYAAAIMRKKALRLVNGLKYEGFEREVVKLISAASGLNAGEFRVAEFVISLFDIQRRFGVYGTASFSMIIIALLAFEGVARTNWPSLDFQGIALESLVENQF
jgi:ubiquinone biosynthesis protein